MLIINITEGENIERALKRYKQKFKKTQQLALLRENQQFTKKSVTRRAEINKAIHKQTLQDKAEE